MPGLQVHIVASSLRMSPTLRGDEDPKPLLVGGFVLREANITIDAPDTVLGLEVAHRGVELCKAMDELGGEVHEAIVASLVLRLVCIEPLTVVVQSELREERKNLVHIIPWLSGNDGVPLSSREWAHQKSPCTWTYRARCNAGAVSCIGRQC